MKPITIEVGQPDIKVSDYRIKAVGAALSLTPTKDGGLYAALSVRAKEIQSTDAGHPIVRDRNIVTEAWFTATEADKLIDLAAERTRAVALESTDFSLAIFHDHAGNLQIVIAGAVLHARGQARDEFMKNILL
jgi:hypothetical protein